MRERLACADSPASAGQGEVLHGAEGVPIFTATEPRSRGEGATSQNSGGTGGTTVAPWLYATRSAGAGGAPTTAADVDVCGEMQGGTQGSVGTTPNKWGRKDKDTKENASRTGSECMDSEERTDAHA